MLIGFLNSTVHIEFYDFLEIVAKGCILQSWEMQWFNLFEVSDNFSVLF